jgi:hypothetical protein
LGFLLVWSLASLAPAAQPKKLDFNRDIKPILSNNCYQCHGPDPAERKGGTAGLRLDTAEGALADQGGHAAIVPGKPEASELIARIKSADADAKMPPPQSGKKLSPQEIELLTQWIRDGAGYEGHWSYGKPVRPPLPTVKAADWPKNEIDYFILARLEREGLGPMPEADRYALIRRVSLDLTGLPPTIAEVDEFVNDQDPKAYEKLVERLLAKQSYGEHWARMWLDLGRYADSAGYADDPPRKIWLFRDYVIRSLNANKPFDQFTIEQIAGDLLPNPTDDQLIATAFHRNTLTNNEGGTNDEEFRNVAIVDRVNTTMAVWMGTTIACAQCHTHKYDPLSQEEYFKLFAFFNNTEDADRTDESPLLSIYSPEQLEQRSQWQGELANLEQQLKTLTPALEEGLAKWDADFPRGMKWQTDKPLVAKAESGSTASLAEDASITVKPGAKEDTYTVELPATGEAIRAIRLETLTDDALPEKGPGHAAGNFVITRIAATMAPPRGAGIQGRYVRVELPGKGKFLSLAEVQVFRGAENVALQGEASQISTDYDGPAKLAIDGNTTGKFDAKSTTHTAASDNPWWEVDLKREQSIDRLVVWNRLDGVESRLAGYKVTVLNDKREPVWQQANDKAPIPSQEFSVSGQRSVEFQQALADYSQSGFEAEGLVAPADPKQKKKPQGWGIGGQTGQPHTLTLLTREPIAAPAGSKLVVTIEQKSPHANHTLGKFRLTTTSDPQVATWAKTPASVLAALNIPAAERKPEQNEALVKHYLQIATELEPQRKRQAELTKSLADLKPNTVPIQRELPEGKRRVTKLQHRGNFQDLGQEVTAGTPAIFPPLPQGVPVNRLALAQWLVDENNPLTARVIANRYWEQLFGIGIVATSEEFGSQGELPFHPELLDWLATELVRLKWDTKAFVKTLVMSAAYRQSSKTTADLVQRDPENRLLARGPRFRLSAEMLRDMSLAASGQLSSKMYGPPVRPPQPVLGVSAAFGGGIDWTTSAGEDKYRRALYVTWRRSNPYPSMATFDAPNREVCTVRRVRTNTPLQALVSLNDPVYIEAAQALGRRMVAEGGSTVSDRARHGFRLVLARPPQDAELGRLVALYEQSLAKYSQNAEAAKKMATDPIGPVPPGMTEPELAAWSVVGNVLLNLDEAVMKR